MAGIMENKDFDDSSTFRILMLHGFAGTISDFAAKANRITQQITKTVTPEILSEFPGGIQFLHPDAPHLLECPVGFERDVETEGPGHEATALGWWYGRDTVSYYKGLDFSLAYLADYLRNQADGPIHAVVGFSQGACLAGMVTSLLESKGNREKIDAIREQGLPVDDWVTLPKQQPLRWFIGIGGYCGSYYDALYRWPLKTPSCHTLASLDAVVEHYQTMELAECFDGFDVLAYHGSHFVPRDKKSVDELARFALRCSVKDAKRLADYPSAASGTATPSQVSSSSSSSGGEAGYMTSSSSSETDGGGSMRLARGRGGGGGGVPVLTRSKRTNVVVRRRRTRVNSGTPSLR